MGWTTDIRFPAKAGIFPCVTTSRQSQEPTNSPMQWVPAALSLGVRRSGREADHSLKVNADYVKKQVEATDHLTIEYPFFAQT